MAAILYFGDSSFYGNLGDRNDMPIVCSESNDTRLICYENFPGHVSIDTAYEASVLRYTKMAAQV